MVSISWSVVCRPTNVQTSSFVKYPSKKKTGSLGDDLPSMIERFSKGVEYSSQKDPYELDYGVVEIAIGLVS